MKCELNLIKAALVTLFILPAQGGVDEFFKSSPLGKGRLEAERILKLDEGSLSVAQSTSAMELVGKEKVEDVDFTRRIHFSKSKPSGYELYADGDPSKLERVWINVGDALSKIYGDSPVVIVPQERLGELSPIGDTSGKLKCWSNSNYALGAFLEIAGNKAYLIVGQYDLQSEGIPLLDDTSTSKYLREVFEKQSGKLPDLWKPGETAILSPANENRIADVVPNGVRSKQDGALENFPENSGASDRDDDPNHKSGWSHWLWGSVAIVLLISLGYLLLARTLKKRRSE